MNEELKGEVIVVTGGSSGIGDAIVKLCVEEKANVAILDLEKPRADRGGAFYRVDVSEEAQVADSFRRIREEMGPVTGLVNNAGISPKSVPSESVEKEDILKTFGVNVFGPMFCNKYAIMQMKEAGHGSIVNISSVIGVVGSKNSSVYAASKAALIGMTKADAITYSQDNIRVNAVIPGYVHTPLIEKASIRSGDPNGFYDALKAKHPVGRLAQPDEIAQAVVFLLSARSSFMTGSSLVVDGGYTAL
ncbi:MAG: SDR family oxidoreductase [Thermoplasmatales archaeon]